MSTPKGFHLLICLLRREIAPIELKCASDDTVYAVKRLIQDEPWGFYPPDHQRLIYKGSQLEDDRTLHSYSIESGDKVIFMLNGRGS